MISFTVFGKPQPAGSKRAFVNKKTGRAQVVDANANAKPWKQEVKGEALEALFRQAKTTVILGPPTHGPIRLHVTFFLQRPKSHFGTGKNAEKLKDSAPAFPTVKPDATKLLRGLEDALTGLLWRDDAQVVAQTVRKVYGSPERADVVVEEIL